MGETVLELKDISKSFGGVQALKKVNFKVDKGEVLGVVGENGAGKSTLMKIIVGALKPSSGKVYYKGKETNFKNPLDSMTEGISIVYQEPNIFGDMSVLENLFLGNEEVNGFGSIDWESMYNNAKKALSLVELPEDIISKNMSDLSIGNQQLVLIARGVFQKCEVLILDEPTSILSHSETDTLFKIIRKLKSEGVSILYISHRMEEITTITDNIVVLRDGEVTANLRTEEVTEDKIINAMSGRIFDMNIYRKRDLTNSPELINVNNISNNKYYKNISFTIKKGEIVGMYGLVGSGRSEVARTIFGDITMDSGKIYFDNEEMTNYNIKHAVNKGIYYLPEDRGVQGLFNLNSVKENMSAAFIDDFTNKFGFLDKKREIKAIEENIDRYKIKAQNMEAKITSLSGGNQQKVLFCRWLLKQPRLLILDEPTRGVDVGTKTEMHNYIMDLATEGVSILLISSDLPEVLMLSDRLLTMREGQLTGILNRDEISEETVLRLSIGLK